MIINSITEGENKGSKASSLQQQQQQQHQQHQQQQQQQRQQTIITTEKEILEAIKNPRNITVLNPLLRKFNADVGTMVGCEDSIEESKIATTLNDYIENFYIKYATIVLGKRASKVFIQKPTLRNLPPDLARKSSSSSNRGDGRRGSSSKRRKGGSGSSELGSSGRGGGDDEGEEGGGGDDDDDESFYIGTKKVLDSVLSVYQIVRMIVKDLTAMPRFGDKFIAILNSILNKFHGYCETMYNECIPPGSEAVKFLTGKNEKEVTDFLHHDPSWVRVGSSASVSHSRAQSSALSSSSSAAAPVQPSRVFSSTAAAVTAASSAATAIRSRAMSGTGGTGIPAAGAVTGMGSGVVPGGKRSAGTVFSEAEQLDEIRRFQPSAIISTENRIAPTALIMDADTTIRLSDLHNSLDWFVYRLYLLVGFTDAGGGEGSGNSSSNTGGALGADFVSTRSNQRNTFKMYLKRVTMYVPTAVSAASAVVSAAEGYGKDHGPRPRASVALTQGKGGGMPNGPTTTAAAAVAKLQQQLKAAESAERSLSLAILNFTGLFSKVCEQAIFTLRVDLKFQCVYFLSLCRKHCYCCDESEILADSCVIELNHRLAATEKALNLHLQPRRMKFVISGIAPLICDVMINTASSIKKVNNPGIRKLLRNVFAIQQNLGPIVARKEAFFDRVRQYYEMLYLSDYSELYAHVAQRIADGKPVFNVEQYVTILEIIRPGKKPDAESTRQLQTLLLSYI